MFNVKKYFGENIQSAYLKNNNHELILYLYVHVQYSIWNKNNFINEFIRHRIIPFVNPIQYNQVGISSLT